MVFLFLVLRGTVSYSTGTSSGSTVNNFVRVRASPFQSLLGFLATVWLITLTAKYVFARSFSSYSTE
jgi:hypothetical protein